MAEKKNIQVLNLKKRRFNKQKILAFLTIAVAVALIGAGLNRTKIITFDKQIWEEDQTDFPEIISELQLLEDSTFSGVEYIDGKLYTNYDRTQAKTKKACPT
jgi:hypothetical protein